VEAVGNVMNRADKGEEGKGVGGKEEGKRERMVVERGTNEIEGKR
jgi:hypothetical protein